MNQQFAADGYQFATHSLQDKTVSTSKVADRTIRIRPYQAIGIALGVGALIGLVAMRKRHD